MDVIGVLTTGEKIALWGVVVAAAVGIVPIIYFLRKGDSNTYKVDVQRIDGDGAVIGGKATVKVNKRMGVDGQIVVSKMVEEAEAKREEIFAKTRDYGLVVRRRIERRWIPAFAGMTWGISNSPLRRRAFGAGEPAASNKMKKPAINCGDKYFALNDPQDKPGG